MTPGASLDLQNALSWHPFAGRVVPVYQSDTVQFLLALRNGGGPRLEAICCMSLNLLGAVQQLASVLRRHFTTTGNPPRAPFWSYPIDRILALDEKWQRSQFDDAVKPEVRTFAALIAGEPHRLAVDALRHVPPIAEASAALRGAKEWIDLERPDPTSARCCHLFDQLCETDWFKRNDSSPVFRFDGKRALWGYILKPVKDRFLLDLVEAAHQTLASNITTALALDDEEQEIVNLLAKIGHRVSTNELLGEFNRRGNPKAESTTKTKLALMGRKGAINNRQDVKPPGYGLPHWP